eukprot:4071372-Pleurochrysis_carterae.AAC.2
MLIVEFDVNAAMNATPFQDDTAVALITPLKHAFEVPKLLHDPVLALVVRTAQLSFNVVAKNAFLRLRLWCFEKKQMQEFDELCRYMTERHLSKYVSSTRVNSCESFSGFAEAREVTEVFIKLVVAFERYFEPESPASAPGSDCCSDTTSDDNVISPANFSEPGPEFCSCRANGSRWHTCYAVA